MNAALQICQQTISGPEVQDAIHRITICSPVQKFSQKLVDFGGDVQVGSMQSILSDPPLGYVGLRRIVCRQIAVQESKLPELLFSDQIKRGLRIIDCAGIEIVRF